MSAMQARTAALLAALALVSGWALGERFGTDPGAGSRRPISSGPRPLGVEQAWPTGPFTDRLRQKLDRRPARPQTSRNPFAFGVSRGPGIEPARPAPEPTRPPSPGGDVEPPPSGPVLTLSGMAASQEGDAVEYTAIVSDGEGLHFVRRGDSLPGGYTVVEVHETTITIRDAHGGERTLGLR